MPERMLERLDRMPELTVEMAEPSNSFQGTRSGKRCSTCGTNDASSGPALASSSSPVLRSQQKHQHDHSNWNNRFCD